MKKKDNPKPKPKPSQIPPTSVGGGEIDNDEDFRTTDSKKETPPS